MIIKGMLNGDGRNLAKYLISTTEKTDKAELIDLHGFGVGKDDIVLGFVSQHFMADAMPQCEKPFFHAAVQNTDRDRALTNEEWIFVADSIERRLGLEGQGRAIALHTEEGKVHAHIAWTRIDLDTVTARPLPFFKARCKDLARELEIDLDLERVPNHRQREQRAARLAEEQQGRRIGADIRAIRTGVLDAWGQTDNGRTFAQAISDQGHIMARGDRRDVVIVYAGEHGHGTLALGKRLLGEPVADIRARMDDLDPALLPSVAEARERLTQMRGRRPGLGEPELHSAPAPARTIEPKAKGFDSTRQITDQDLRLHDGAARAAPEIARRQDARAGFEREAGHAAKQIMADGSREAVVAAHADRIQTVLRALDAGDIARLRDAQRQHGVVFAAELGNVFAVTGRKAEMLEPEQGEKLRAMMEAAFVKARAAEQVGRVLTLSPEDARQYMDTRPDQAQPLLEQVSAELERSGDHATLPSVKAARAIAYGMERRAAFEDAMQIGLAKSERAGDGGAAFAKHLDAREITLKRDYGDRLHVQERGGREVPLERFVRAEDQAKHLAALLDAARTELPKFVSQADKRQAFEERQQQRAADREARSRGEAASRAARTAQRAAEAPARVLGKVAAAGKPAGRVLESVLDAVASFGNWGDEQPGAPARGSVPNTMPDNDASKAHWIQEQLRKSPGASYLERIANLADPVAQHRSDAAVRKRDEERRGVRTDIEQGLYRNDDDQTLRRRR